MTRTKRFARYEQIIRKALQSRRCPSDLADDVSQESLLRCVQLEENKSTECGDEEKRLDDALVATIALNILFSWHRRRQPREQLSEIVDNSSQSDPSLEIEKEEARQRLRSLVEKLRSSHPSYVRAIEMFWLEDKSHAEIARSENIAPETSKQRVCRGKRMIRSLADKHGLN